MAADILYFQDSIGKYRDTVITMITGRKVLVREGADEVRCRALEYRRSIGPVIPRPAMLQPGADQQEG